MKRYKYIFSSCLAVLFGVCLLTGCVKNEMIKGEEEGAVKKPLLTVVAGVSETVGTRVDDPSNDIQNANGSWIENMTIFLFATDAVDNSVPLLVSTAKVEGSLSQENQINAVELTKKQLSDLNLIGVEVDIYAIANYIPNNAANLTKKQVVELKKDDLPEYKSTGSTQPVVSMSGVATNYVITNTLNQQINITLQRAIIRVELTVIDAEYDKDMVNNGERTFIMNKVALYNDYSKTYLWKDGIQLDPDCRTEQNAVGEDFGGVMDLPRYELNPIYLNCNESSVANPEPANKITVQVECELFTESTAFPLIYTIELKDQDGTYNFNRNTALKVTIKLKKKGYSTDVVVVPWNVDREDADINPTGIRFVDTNLPAVIPQDGKLNASFNFENPANIPFKLYMFVGDTHTGTQLNELEPIASKQQVEVTQLADNPSGTYRSVSFWYKYDDVWVDTGVRAVQGEKETDATIQPKANTYLVAPNGKSILIPVAQANSASIPGIGVNEELTAELVWTDVKGTKSNKGLADDAAVAAIAVIGTGPDAFLMVTPGSQLGNAVIAVKSGNVIKWSWNIWVTDYNPEQETGQNTSGGYIFMDRNLGAKSIVPNANSVDIGGNFYQYGRKDPFPTKGSGKAFVTAYNAAGTVVVNQFNSISSVESQIRNPYTWGGYTSYPAGMGLWGEKGAKTVNDPCPAGWRVPPSGAYVDITDALMPVDAAVAGRQGAHTGYYPYTWMVNGNAGTFWDLKLVANWTSTASASGSTAWMLRGDLKGTIHPKYSWYVNFGNAVRCVRDWENKKFEKEVRVLSAGNYSVSKAHQLGTHDVNPGWSSGIVNLLNRNFGKGDPVDAFFKHYNYYKGGFNVDGTDYDIIDLLATHEIDVLYLPWNGDQTSPTADQSKKIVGWLDADPNRVLIVATEFHTQHDMLMAELGFAAHSYIQDGSSSVLAGSGNEFYSTITNGAYGKLAATEFKNILGNGWIPKSEIDKNGYVPILTRMNDVNKVTMSINPTRRVLLIGDTNWFDPGNALGGTGSLDYKGFGEYPILMANTWAWIVETVKAK